MLDTYTGKIMLFAWSVVSFSVISSLLLRVSREDQILRIRFGEEWEMWAREVPYQFLPGIY